jgi:phosphoribosylaminoimidazole-succinocarboxamide synthase
MLVKKCKILPVEAIVRGYITGTLIIFEGGFCPNEISRKEFQDLQ